MIFRLEMVTVPVSDIDRAKAFYVDQVGFRLVQDRRIDETHRFVELLPPGSRCSVALTSGYIDAAPGSLQGAQLDVEDADAAHSFLREHAVDVSAVQAFPWGRFCFFSDPDGNGWSVHEVPVQVRKTYVIVVVANMDRALRFYVEAFGATVDFASPEWSEVEVAGSTVALHPGGDGTETVTGLGFEVPDLDAALAQVVRCGGRVTRPARDRPAERIRLAEVADTEGNLLTVAEARPHRPPRADRD